MGGSDGDSPEVPVGSRYVSEVVELLGDGGKMIELLEEHGELEAADLCRSLWAPRLDEICRVAVGLG